MGQGGCPLLHPLAQLIGCLQMGHRVAKGLLGIKVRINPLCRRSRPVRRSLSSKAAMGNLLVNVEAPRAFPEPPRDILGVPVGYRDGHWIHGDRDIRLGHKIRHFREQGSVLSRPARGHRGFGLLVSRQAKRVDDLPPGFLNSRRDAKAELVSRPSLCLRSSDDPGDKPE